jgi:hypothetical protein
VKSGSTFLLAARQCIATHWGPDFLLGVSSTGEPLAGVNAITTSACCPTSKQPELKHAAVKILKAELPWTLLAVQRLEALFGLLAGDTSAEAWLNSLFRRGGAGDRAPRRAMQRLARGAAGLIAGPAQMRHELRLLRARSVIPLAQAA